MKRVVHMAAIVLLCLTVVVDAVPMKAAPESEKMIAFTFDDGPNPLETTRLLDGLLARHAYATFFVIAAKIDPANTDSRTEMNQALVKRMVAEGHVVGNHTYSHCFLTGVSPATVAAELNKANAVIQQVTGEQPRYMRPPGGAQMTAPWIRQIAAPMITVCWNGVDTRDWQNRDVPAMVQTITSGAKDGSIVLLHDNYATSVDVALMAMDQLAQEGYRFVTVDTLLARNLSDQYELNPLRIYSAMYPGDVSKLKKKTPRT